MCARRTLASEPCEAEGSLFAQRRSAGARRTLACGAERTLTSEACGAERALSAPRGWLGAPGGILAFGVERARIRAARIGVARRTLWRSEPSGVVSAQRGLVSRGGLWRAEPGVRS